MLHIAKDTPRDDVMVSVLSAMSTNTQPIKKFTFQAAVPKVCISIFVCVREYQYVLWYRM